MIVNIVEGRLAVETVGAGYDGKIEKLLSKFVIRNFDKNARNMRKWIHIFREIATFCDDLEMKCKFRKTISFNAIS
jgi:hypothetical protein